MILQVIQLFKFEDSLCSKAGSTAGNLRGFDYREPVLPFRKNRTRSESMSEPKELPRFKLCGLLRALRTLRRALDNASLCQSGAPLASSLEGESYGTGY